MLIMRLIKKKEYCRQVHGSTCPTTTSSVGQMPTLIGTRDTIKMTSINFCDSLQHIINNFVFVFVPTRILFFFFGSLNFGDMFNEHTHTHFRFQSFICRQYRSNENYTCHGLGAERKTFISPRLIKMHNV